MASELTDISSIFMRSTFKIQGNKSLGTAFIMGEPIPGSPGKGAFVLITAAHVLEEMEGDIATIFLRKKINDKYIKFPTQIQIRREGKPLWIRHSQVDIAAMRIALPEGVDIQIFSTELLATDKMLEEFEIHPGDELIVLGFPYGAEANDAGFPILRSGRIASFPLTPTESTKLFLLDFAVFKGNSGGPVFMHAENRNYKGGTVIGVTRMVMGLVSQEMSLKERIESLSETMEREHKLGIAMVVHAQFIGDTIKMLPPLPIPVEGK